MTPAARLSAAIGVLDAVLDGQAAEAALTAWSRASRFAGSGDRAAVRDLVFDALRCRRSFAALGGGLTGRGLVLGGVRAAGRDVSALFTGIGHAPPPVGDADLARTPEPLEALDCPDWLAGPLQAAMGADFAPVLAAMRHRAPVFLRVNAAKVTVELAMASLARDGIVAVPHDLAKYALQVTDGERKIQTSQTYLTGLVELQDAASQAVVEALPLISGQRVLDYCAGGGGKAIAMAAFADVQIWAHDGDPRRMRDLPLRAARGGVTVHLSDNPVETAPFDGILMDVPCSGSGSWRRDPQGKWALTAARLDQVCAIQAAILTRCAALAAQGGWMAYVTCSLLRQENEDQVSGFVARSPEWRCTDQRRFTPLQGGDGFFLALLTRS